MSIIEQFLWGIYISVDEAFDTNIKPFLEKYIELWRMQKIKLEIYENEFDRSYCKAYPDCKVRIYNVADDYLAFKKDYKPEYSKGYHTPSEVFLVNIYKIKCKKAPHYLNFQ